MFYCLCISLDAICLCLSWPFFHRAFNMPQSSWSATNNILTFIPLFSLLPSSDCECFGCAILSHGRQGYRPSRIAGDAGLVVQGGSMPEPYRETEVIFHSVNFTYRYFASTVTFVVFSVFLVIRVSRVCFTCYTSYKHYNVRPLSQCI